jgi:hypothetical protein
MFNMCSFRSRDNVEKYRRTGYAAEDNVILRRKNARIQKHIVLRLTALPLQQTVTRTRLYVTLYVHCPS